VARPVTTRTRTERRERAWEMVVPKRTGVEEDPDAKLIALSLIDPNPDQPRRGALPEIPELAESIREHGLLQPIVVAQRPGSDRYQIVAGHRRFAAHQLLLDEESGRPGGQPSRWLSIRAYLTDAATAQRRLMALVENVSRQNLADAEIIRELRVLHDMEGLHQAEIARLLGVSKAWIGQYFRVASDDELSEQVQRDRLTVAKAYDIQLAKSPEGRRAALDAALAGAPLRTIRRLAKEGPDSAADGAAAGQHAAGDTGDGHAPSAAAERKVAFATTDAWVRDTAALAGELELTINLADRQIAKLIRAALKANTGTLDLQSFIKATRADLRKADALVRAAPRREASGEQSSD
jgi:ParB/RepB/Spo0J family partition protein